MKDKVNDQEFYFQLYQYNDKPNASKLDKSQYIAQMFDDFYALKNVGKYKEILHLETDVSPKNQIKQLYDQRAASYIFKRGQRIEKKKEKILFKKFLSESAKKAAAANSDDDPERKNKKGRYEDDACSSTSRSPKAFRIFHSSDDEDEEEIESVGHGFETPKKSPRMSERKVRRQYNTRSSKAEPLVLSSSDSSSSSDDSDDVSESE